MFTSISFPGKLKLEDPLRYLPRCLGCRDKHVIFPEDFVMRDQSNKYLSTAYTQSVGCFMYLLLEHTSMSALPIPTPFFDELS